MVSVLGAETEVVVAIVKTVEGVFEDGVENVEVAVLKLFV